MSLERVVTDSEWAEIGPLWERAFSSPSPRPANPR